MDGKSACEAHSNQSLIAPLCLIHLVVKIMLYITFKYINPDIYKLMYSGGPAKKDR